MKASNNKDHIQRIKQLLEKGQTTVKINDSNNIDYHNGFAHFLMENYEFSNSSIGNYFTAYLTRPKTTPQNGSDFIRNMVKWIDGRAEVLNENKSLLTLISEYRKENKI